MVVIFNEMFNIPIRDVVYLDTHLKLTESDSSDCNNDRIGSTGHRIRSE